MDKIPWRIGLAALLAFAPLACSSGSKTPAPSASTPIIKNNVHVIDQATSDQVDVEPNELILPAAGNDAFLQRVQGDILVGYRQDTATGKNPDGFLRKVVSVARSGSQIIVKTTQASLTDAIQQGEASINVPIKLPNRLGQQSYQPGQEQGFPGMRPQSIGLPGGTLDFSGKLLDLSGSAGSLSAELTQAKLAFNPSVDLGIKLGFFKVKEFHAILNGNMMAALALKVATTANVNADPKVNLLPAPIEIPLPHLKIGPFPIEVTLEIQATAEAQVHINGKASIEAGVTAKSQVQVGARYQDGNWSKVAQSSFSYSPIGPTFTDSVGASIKVMVPKVTFTFKLYGVAGPSLTVDPYASFALYQPPNCTWKMSAGLSSDFTAASIPILGTKLGQLSKILNSYQAVKNGSYSLPGVKCSGDAGAEAGTPDAGSGGSGGSGGSTGTGGSSGTSGTAGAGGSSTSSQTCAELAKQDGWSNTYCETGGNGACGGRGPKTSDCDHCCSGSTCAQLMLINKWSSDHCETGGNNACNGAGTPTMDCDFCCGSSCTFDSDCSNGAVCALTTSDTYCCQDPNVTGTSCASNAECTAPQVCRKNGSGQYVCATPKCL